MSIDTAILARQVQELRDRQEITDVLHTYLDCADRCDFDRQYESSFHADAVFIYQKGSEPVAARAFFDRIKSADSLGAGFLQTMHYLSNILIRLDGDQAVVQSLIFAQHLISAQCPDLPPNFPNLGKDYGLLIGARYNDLFTKRNGSWRIASRELTYEWDARIDPSQVRGTLSSNRTPVLSDLWSYKSSG
jgi:hypothetical protein